jgi:hypothetical protein
MQRAAGVPAAAASTIACRQSARSSGFGQASFASSSGEFARTLDRGASAGPVDAGWFAATQPQIKAAITITIASFVDNPKLP